MSKIMELPLVMRLLVFLGVPVLIIILIIMFNPDKDTQPDFGTGPTGSPTAPVETPRPTPEPTEQEPVDPEIVKQEEFAEKEENKANDMRKYDEESLLSSPDGVVESSQEFAIEALENYYAFSLNEPIPDRKNRLSKFFLPQSEYLLSSPDGTLDLDQEIPTDPSERLDIGGSIGSMTTLSYKDGEVTHLAFMRIKTRINALASDENKAWIFTNDIEVQITVKKFDGKWKVLSILEQGEVAR